VTSAPEETPQPGESTPAPEESTPAPEESSPSGSTITTIKEVTVTSPVTVVSTVVVTEARKKREAGFFNAAVEYMKDRLAALL